MADKFYDCLAAFPDGVDGSKLQTMGSYHGRRVSQPATESDRLY